MTHVTPYQSHASLDPTRHRLKRVDLAVDIMIHAVFESFYITYNVGYGSVSFSGAT